MEKYFHSNLVHKHICMLLYFVELCVCCRSLLSLMTMLDASFLIDMTLELLFYMVNIFSLFVETPCDPCALICQLTNFGSPFPHCVLCLHSSPRDIFGNLDVFNSPLDHGVASICYIFLWYFWIPQKKMHHVITCSWREIGLCQSPCLKCNVHVNLSTWIAYFLDKKSSSPLSEKLNSCGNLGVGDAGTLLLNEHALCEDNCMSRVPSNDVDYHFFSCNMCGECTRRHWIVIVPYFELVSAFVYESSLCFEHFDTYKKEQVEITSHDTQMNLMIKCIMFFLTDLSHSCLAKSWDLHCGIRTN